MKNNYILKLGWLYPRLMSTYGDRGNIIILKKRCALRSINFEVVDLDESTKPHEIKTLDLVFGGGAQDLEQTIVMQDLKGEKQKYLLEKIEDHMPALFVCGAPQLMGKFYEPAVGERLSGVGIFDMETKHPGSDEKRLIGNIAAKINWKNFRNYDAPKSPGQNYVVGFENHGGRTTLGKDVLPFANVISGFGNNGTDKTEGVVYKNAVGTYLHGPLFSKNPHMADWLIRKSLEVKYQEEIALTNLDDSLEYKAQMIILRRLGVKF